MPNANEREALRKLRYEKKINIREEFKGRNRPDEYDCARPVERGGQAGPIRRDPMANSKLKSLSISVAKSLPLIHECWPRGEEDSDGRVRIAKKLTKLVSPSRRRAFELGAEFYANKPEVESPGRKRADVGPGNVKILFILLNGMFLLSFTALSHLADPTMTNHHPSSFS
ncbi:hypothetical protein RUM44_010829 [Polyplax serrata]|uniref:Uncharacterized protein n=1 Tax=Polyplax serrata TaxID=468196 RepID=A0ABR1ANZ9_POLSC